MNCPNWKHPDMQNLVNELGKGSAYIAYIKNGDTPPTLEKAHELLGIMGGISDSDTKLKPVTLKRLDDFLTKRGIQIVNFSKAEAIEYGKKWGLTKKNMTAGVADTCNGIIGLLERHENVTFGEEAGHMAYAMLKDGNPKLANEMFKKIGQYAIFDKVIRDPLYINNPLYKKDGKLDVAAIKEEAIGKLLKEHLANETGQANKLEDFERVLAKETPEHVSTLQKWWDKALQWFKQIFNKYDDNPFKEVAKQMLGTSENEFKGSKDTLPKEGGTFLSVKSDEEFDNLKKIDSSLSLVDGKFKMNDKDVRFKADDSELFMEGKGAKELDEKGRLDMKDIFNRYLDENGLPKKLPDARSSESNLDPGKTGAYEKLEANLAERIASFPDGTRFLHNINIYNNAKDPSISGKAARIDLLAMTPDGKANIYNFQFVRNADGIVDNDITFNKQQASREYLKDVKGILSRGYGIKVFGQSRTIPIKVNLEIRNNKVGYKKDSLEIGGVNSKISDKAYLHPIPTFDERTGNVKLDKLIDKFLDLYESKEKSSSKSEGRLLGMYYTANAIRHMQVDLGVPILNYHIKLAVDSSNRATEDFLETVRISSPDDMSVADLASKATALDMRENDLITYQNAYLHYSDKVNKIDEDSTPEEIKDQENLTKLKDMSEKARSALFELQSARREFADFISQKWKVFGAGDAEKEMGFYSRFMRPFNKPTTAVQTVFYKMKSETNRSIDERIRPYIDRLAGIENDLKEWQKGGKKYTDMLDLLKEKGKDGKRTNKLIKQFKSEFYEEYEEAEAKADSGDVSGKVWIRNNIDIPALKLWLDARRDKRRDDLNREYPQNVRSNNPQAQADWYSEMQNNNKYNKITNDKVLLQYGRKFPKKIWATSEFEALNKPENAAVKKYYDFIQEVNAVAAESGYIDWDKSKRFLPFIHKSMSESAVLGGEYSLANSVLRSLTISDVDINYGQVNRFTNEKYESLPKFFTHDMGKDAIDKDGNKYTSYSDVSEDLLPNTALFISKVIEYDENSKIEPLVKSLLWLEKNKDSLQTNYLGRIIEGSEPKHDNTKNYEAFKDVVSFQLYGKSYTNKADAVSEANAGKSYNKFVDKTNKFFGFKILSRVDEGGRYSVLKTIDAIKNFQMLKTLGFNMSVPLYRMLSTNIQGYIQAGEYYNHMELSRAELRHGALQVNKNSAPLHILMMKAFFPVEGQLHEEIRRMSVSHLTRDTLPDWMMMLTKRTHDWIQYVNYDAMMNNAVVIDGKVYNARKYIQQSEQFSNRYKNMSFTERKTAEKEFESKVKDLIGKHGLIGKSKEVNGKLVIDGLDLNDESVTRYIGVTRNMGLKLSGNITKENEINARRNAFIRQFFMYKSWLPGMIESRYTPLSYKEGEEDYQWGRIRMVARIASDNILTSVSRLTSMMRATDKGVQLMSDLYDKKKEEYEDSTGKEFKMTKPAFYDMVRRNIEMEVKEISAQLLLLSGVIAMFAAVKDVDKDKKGAFAFAARVIDRSYEELNMYYNPASMQNIANGSLLPSLGFPLDITKFVGALAKEGFGIATGDEHAKKSAHVFKHTVKMFPIAGQVPNWMGVVMPEYMKSLGYNPDATEMHH